MAKTECESVDRRSRRCRKKGCRSEEVIARLGVGRCPARSESQGRVDVALVRAATDRSRRFRTGARAALRRRGRDTGRSCCGERALAACLGLATSSHGLGWKPRRSRRNQRSGVSTSPRTDQRTAPSPGLRWLRSVPSLLQLQQTVRHTVEQPQRPHLRQTAKEKLAYPTPFFDLPVHLLRGTLSLRYHSRPSGWSKRDRVCSAVAASFLGGCVTPAGSRCHVRPRILPGGINTEIASCSNAVTFASLKYPASADSSLGLLPQLHTTSRTSGSKCGSSAAWSLRLAATMIWLSTSTATCALYGWTNAPSESA